MNVFQRESLSTFILFISLKLFLGMCSSFHQILFIYLFLMLQYLSRFLCCYLFGFVFILELNRDFPDLMFATDWRGGMILFLFNVFFLNIFTFYNIEEFRLMSTVRLQCKSISDLFQGCWIKEESSLNYMVTYVKGTGVFGVNCSAWKIRPPSALFPELFMRLSLFSISF